METAARKALTETFLLISGTADDVVASNLGIVFLCFIYNSIKDKKHLKVLSGELSLISYLLAVDLLTSLMLVILLIIIHKLLFFYS